MFGVELYRQVRLAVFRDGLSQREAARRFGIDRGSVKKMLEHSAPPGYRRSRPPARSRMDAHAAFIEQILAADQSAPKKQRHTIQRIYERLVAERGFEGGYTTVRDYVRPRRLALKEVFVPLAHPPGHAQADFGEARAVIGGVERKIHFLVVDLPQSDAIFVKAYPAETAEAFCDGHVAAFDFLGGVPLSVLYDNTRLAVAKILGDGTRLRSKMFSGLQSHYLFEDRFGRPGKGNDKGKVEGMVGFARRTFMVPFPQAADFDGFERDAGRAVSSAPGEDVAAEPGDDRRAPGDGSFGVPAAPGEPVRGLRSARRPGEQPSSGSLQEQRLLGPVGLRPSRGDGEGLCRRGRDRLRRRGDRAASTLLRDRRLHLRPSALSRRSGAQGRRARPGGAAAGLGSAGSVRDAAAASGGAAQRQEPLGGGQARVCSGAASSRDAPAAGGPRRSARRAPAAGDQL